MIDVRWYEEGEGPRAETDWTQRVTWEGNLFGAFEAIYGPLIKELPVPFALVNGYRTGQSDQQVGVREAFVNLLVHADYSDRAASLVIRSTGGFSFRNPGSSRVPDLDPAQGDRSDPRNPNLVRMFRFIGLAEEAGSGVPRIVRAWRNLGYELPAFDLGSQQYEFTARLQFSHLFSEDDRSWLKELRLSLDEDEQLALVLARHNGYVDNASLRQVTGRHYVEITRVLGGLRDRGVLEMLGAKRGARYELSVHIGEQAGTADSAVSRDGSDPNTEGLATNTEGLPSDTEGLATNTEDLSSDTDIQNRERTVRLRALAQVVATTGKIDAAKRDDIILSMCAIRPLSVEELAAMLDRSVAHMREILRPLIRQERIRYLYPDRPRSRKQRYWVAASDGPPGTADADSDL